MNNKKTSIKGIINNDNYPAPDEFLETNNKKGWKSYLPIILIVVFLIIFLSSLVFEFYHIVNKKNPSVVLTENDRQTKQEVIEENSNFYLDKIKDFFSTRQQEKDLSTEKQEDTKLVETELVETELVETKTIEKQPESTNITSTNNNPTPDNAPLTNTISSDQFQTIPIDKNKHKYSLQLMAAKEENLEKLKKTAKILIKQDYYAYIYRTPHKIKEKFSGEEDYYLRLRIGFFPNKQDAVKVAHKLIRQYPRIFKNYFVALPLKEEYQSNFFIFSPDNQEEN